MTVQELRAKYPESTFDVGMSALHYTDGERGLHVRYDRTQEDALEVAAEALARDIARVRGE